MDTRVINGATLHYEEMGTGPPVVLTPGGRAAREGVRPLAERLAPRHRVIIYDRRNCGASDVIIGGEPSEQEIWADDLAELLRQLDAAPAYSGGGSAGARVSLLLALRHPEVVRGLLLFSVSGGEYAATNLGRNYYDQFVEIAERDGMAGVCASPFFAERIQQNPSNQDRLLSMSVSEFVSVMRRWRTFFTAEKPVIGASEAELATIHVPTIVIYTDDPTHTGPASEAVARNVPGCELHPALWTEEERLRWAQQDGQEGATTRADRMAPVFLDFMARIEVARVPA